MRHGLFIATDVPAMTSRDDKPARPALGDAGQARADSREARRAAALRANLTRRKAQARARRDEREPPPSADADKSRDD